MPAALYLGDVVTLVGLYSRHHGCDAPYMYLKTFDYNWCILYRFNLSELDITVMELAAIAPAARAGLRNPYCPSTGCSNVGTELVTKIG